MLREGFTFNKSSLGNNFKSSDKTENAKKYPIENLYNGKLKKSGKTLMGCCPFHQESIPSFAIYPETNTWNCFAGCGGGDVISYYEKLHQASFTEAVEALINL